jgi:hypothetical protein
MQEYTREKSHTSDQTSTSLMRSEPCSVKGQGLRTAVHPPQPAYPSTDRKAQTRMKGKMTVSWTLV